MEPTVVIPCFNEAGYVGRLQADLTRQTVAPAAVHVVDCYSEDNTVAAAHQFNQCLPQDIIRAPKRSAAAARNEGARRAQTDYLLFLDADMRVAADFVEKLIDCAWDTGANFVSPRFTWEGHHPLDMLYVCCENVRIQRYYMNFKRQPMGLGGAMYVRKAAHDAIGGYNADKYEFDDIDYCKRMGALGVKCAFAGEAVARVSNRRFIEQGRIRTLLQMIPNDNFIGGQIVRPALKAIGVRPKWEDLSAQQEVVAQVPR